MHYLLFILVCGLWGSNFILMKKAAYAFGPISVGAWRVALGAMVLAALFLLRRERWPVRWRHLPHLLVLVLLSYIYPFTVQPYLIGKYDESAFFGMMVVLVPLATMAASVVILRIWPTRWQVIGVLGGLACIGLVFYDGLEARNISPGDLALGLGVPVMYGMGNTYLKRHLHDLPPLALTMSALGIAAILLLPVGLGTEPVDVADDRFPAAVAALLFFGMVGTGVATVMFYRLIHDHGPLYAGMVTYIIPLVALAWGAGDNERLTPVQVAALAGIFVMVALVQASPKRGAKDAEASTAEPAEPAEE